MTLERDFRTLPPSTQADLRRVAVNMVLGGTRRIEVVGATGVSRRYVGQWAPAYQQGGGFCQPSRHAPVEGTWTA